MEMNYDHCLWDWCWVKADCKVNGFSSHHDLSLPFLDHYADLYFFLSVCMLFLTVQQIMIVDLKLTYPSGLATAVLINGFHSQGDKMARYTSSIVLIVERMKLNIYKFYYIIFTRITLTDVLKKIVNKS